MQKQFRQPSNYQLKKYINLFHGEFHQVLKLQTHNTIADFVVNFNNKKYQINQILWAAKQHLLQQLVEKQVNSKLFEEFFSQYSLYFWTLSTAPGIYVEMLNDEEITSQSNVIDLYTFLSKIYKKLEIKGRKRCRFFKQFSGYIFKQILFFLQIVNQQIAFIFNVNRKLIVQEIDQLNSDTKQLRLINKYIIYKLLRQLSYNCYEIVRENLICSVFFNVQPQLIDIFANYIIQKHQTISFENINSNQIQSINIKSHKKNLQDQFVERLLYLSSNVKKIQYSQAVRQDGKKALHIQIQEDNSGRVTSYLVQIDEQQNQLVFMNCNLMRKKWSFIRQSQAETDIEKLIGNKKNLVNTLRGAPMKMEEITLMKNISTLGGSLGSCLANLNKYDSIGSFVLDFSKKTLISGSINYIVEQIPMIGYFLVAGGFSYTFYRLMKNKFKNNKKKAHDIGKIAFSMTSSFGSSLVGAFVGTTLIPIPILGLFIGSVVGGFVGGLTGDVLLNYFQSKKFEKMCQKIDRMINLDGSWTVSKKLLDLIGVNKEFFYENIPSSLEKKMSCDNLWMTVICFCLLSFYESRNKMKELQQRLESQTQNNQYEMQQDGSKYISINLEMSLNYLQKQKINLRKILKYIQRFLEKMFERM